MRNIDIIRNLCQQLAKKRFAVGFAEYQPDMFNIYLNGQNFTDTAASTIEKLNKLINKRN